jgi:hypothetical protein
VRLQILPVPSRAVLSVDLRNGRPAETTTFTGADPEDVGGARDQVDRPAGWLVTTPAGQVACRCTPFGNGVAVELCQPVDALAAILNALVVTETDRQYRADAIGLLIADGAVERVAAQISQRRTVRQQLAPPPTDDEPPTLSPGDQDT